MTIESSRGILFAWRSLSYIVPWVPRNSRQIARDWNAKQDGEGFVARFRVDAVFAARYPVQTVGGSVHKELWVPAAELSEFNKHIVGAIEIVAEFRS